MNVDLWVGVHAVKLVLIYMEKAGNTLFRTPAVKGYFSFLFIFLIACNLYGAMPYVNAPTLFYSKTMFISLSFWLTLTLVSLFAADVRTVAHNLPEGCPMGLAILLPLIEITSKCIRPVTLAVRMSTNLASGHIMGVIIGYFLVALGDAGMLTLGGLALGLQIVEVGVVILQAFIFMALMAMYYSEEGDVYYVLVDEEGNEVDPLTLDWDKEVK